MNRNENEIITVQLPHEYDINAYKFQVAFDKIKTCPYCGTDKKTIIYYRTADDDNILEAIRRIIFNKKKHTLTCKCYECGAITKINFYTDKHCIDLHDVFAKCIDEAKRKK